MEIAAASGVGVRSLQLSFKRVHGCSPHEFVARRRLEEARRKLLAAPPGSTGKPDRDGHRFFRVGPICCSLQRALRGNSFGHARAR
ncbi:helix-turn-helix domain-containing protein [Sinorhizobium meliloti]|nr:helix-turn-helix domain-containing protein [Sinorhizobium meliloti]